MTFAQSLLSPSCDQNREVKYSQLLTCFQWGLYHPLALQVATFADFECSLTKSALQTTTVYALSAEDDGSPTKSKQS